MNADPPWAVREDRQLASMTVAPPAVPGFRVQGHRVHAYAVIKWEALARPRQLDGGASPAWRMSWSTARIQPKGLQVRELWKQVQVSLESGLDVLCYLKLILLLLTWCPCRLRTC